MVFYPAVGTAANVFIISGFLLVGKVSVWLDSKTEHAALPLLAPDPDFAAVGVDECFGKIQPQPRAAYLGARAVRAVEFFEQAGHDAGRYARPFVFDGGFDHTVRGQLRADGNGLAAWRVFDGVVDKVDEHFIDADALYADGGQIV